MWGFSDFVWNHPKLPNPEALLEANTIRSSIPPAQQPPNPCRPYYTLDGVALRLRLWACSHGLVLDLGFRVSGRRSRCHRGLRV